MAKKSRTRLILILILLVSLSLTVLTGGHDVHAGAGSHAATSMVDQHCDSLPCLISLLTLPVSLTALSPIGRTCFQKSPTVASIALPRLDPPPRFAA